MAIHDILSLIRKVCLSFPETSERVSHGAPTFFIRGKRAFVMYHDNHHGDGRLAVWCAADPEIQRILVGATPEHYFAPPYVGHRGWIGVRLDRKVRSKDIQAVIEDAYLTVAPKQLIKTMLPEARRRAANRRAERGPASSHPAVSAACPAGGSRG